MEELAAANRQALALLLTSDRALWTIVAISFSVSLRAILIAAPTALVAAFLLAHLRFPGRRFLISACNTLMALPAVVVGLTIYMLLSRNRPLGDLELLFTQTAMILGQIILGLPLLIAMNYSALRAVDRRAWEAAITLGARPPWAMLTLMYEVRFGLIAALVAAFGRIIAEVGSSMMVGGNILHYTRNIPTAIALETSKGEFAQGIALGLVLSFVLSLLQGKGTSRRAPPAAPLQPAQEHRGLASARDPGGGRHRSDRAQRRRQKHVAQDPGGPRSPRPGGGHLPGPHHRLAGGQGPAATRRHLCTPTPLHVRP